MRAITIDKTGGPEVMTFTEDFPKPTPGDGEVLIKNTFAGINYIDTYFRSGLYASNPFPHLKNSH
jgi:NADPH2:quinone reductase